MDNVWVCGACRSINQPRQERCYRCRTPRHLTEADPEQLVVAGEGSTASRVDPKAIVGTYQPSGDRAFALQLLLVVTAVLSVIQRVMGAGLVEHVLAGDLSALRDRYDLLALGLGLLLSAGATLVAWGLWLSRVVENLPAIGGGWPNVTAQMAFIETFLPGINLFRIPAILRDVLRRLDAESGERYIVAAWLGLVGGIFLPWIVGRVAGFVPLGLDDRVRLDLAVSGVAEGLTVVGVIFLVMVVRWVETHEEAKAAAIPGSGAAPAAPAPAADAAPDAGPSAIPEP